jgi:NADPH2:quinone reductase
MKAWLLDKIGDGIEKLHVAEVPDPLPAAGEVVLRMLLAGLNPADRYLAENQYPAKPALPHILGRDGIGIVEQIGPGVSGVGPGDKRVIVRSEIGVNRPGTFAQRTAVPVESLVEPAPGWTDEQSAGATLVYLTAYQALTQWGELLPSLVLITGASGGVGVACVQLAKAMGHAAVGLSRDPVKSQKLRELGADAVFDPRQSDWRRRMLAEMGGRRVDLAIDNIGGPLLMQVVDSLGYGGKISCVGRLAGPAPQFNTAGLFFRRARLGGVHVGSYTALESQAVWTSVIGLLAKIDARPIVDSVHSFGELREAFGRLRHGPMGKVLLRTSDSPGVPGATPANS